MVDAGAGRAGGRLLGCTGGGTAPPVAAVLGTDIPLGLPAPIPGIDIGGGTIWPPDIGRAGNPPGPAADGVVGGTGVSAPGVISSTSPFRSALAMADTSELRPQPPVVALTGCGAPTPACALSPPVEACWRLAPPAAIR
jgi:hypothetical protein